MPVPLKNMILKKRIRFLTFKDEILSLEILIINKYRVMIIWHLCFYSYLQNLL